MCCIRHNPANLLAFASTLGATTHAVQDKLQVSKVFSAHSNDPNALHKKVAKSLEQSGTHASRAYFERWPELNSIIICGQDHYR